MPSANALRCVLAMTVLVAVMHATSAVAYDQYSISRTAGNCADCHGGFRINNYVSKSDSVAWNSSLHDAHRTTMLSGDCDVCHSGGSRFPVSLKQSNGGSGFSPISCLGCHGRAEAAAGGTVTGAGLRQHHFRNNVTQCGNSGCHTDADPANFTVVGEHVNPPYYFTPDSSHPNKPTDPCNAMGSESALAPSLGLDNDGDNVYDVLDTDCGATAVPESPDASGLSMANVAPNPVIGRGQYHFTLSRRSGVTLTVLDIQGRAVRTLFEGELEAGSQDFEWNGRDAAGQIARSGIYFIRLKAEGRVAQRKFVFLNN